MGGLSKGPKRRLSPKQNTEGIYPTGLRSKLHSAADIVRGVGPWRFAGRVLPWTLCRDYSIFAQSLDRIVPCPPPSVPCVLRPVGKEDIQALMALRKGYYAKEKLERRLEQGHMAFLGWSGDLPVYSYWMLVGSFDVPYLRGRLVLGPGEVWSDEVYVRPEFRRLGLYAYNSSQIRTSVRDKGYRTLFSAVASWNGTPRLNMIRSGMTEIGRLRYRFLPGPERAHWSGRVKVHDDGSFSFQFPA